MSKLSLSRSKSRPTAKSKNEDPPAATTSSLGEYHCPICQKELTDIQSSYLRQQHVEQCLQQQPAKEEEEHEFQYCLFCGKDVSHLKGLRVDIHFSRCLDSLEEENTSIFETLDVCPCCHEPFRRNRRLQHIKQCMNRRGMTMVQLFRKLQWIQWGHVPKPVHRAPPSRPPKQQPPGKIIEWVTFEEKEKDDEDFSTLAVRRPVLKRPNDNDDNDEDFRLALALSRSEMVAPTKKRRQEAPDAACIVSVEESKKLVLQELDRVFTSAPSPPVVTHYKNPLPPSRLLRPCAISYWRLAAAGGPSWQPDNDHVFTCPFLQHKYPLM